MVVLGVGGWGWEKKRAEGRCTPTHAAGLAVGSWPPGLRCPFCISPMADTRCTEVVRVFLWRLGHTGTGFSHTGSPLRRQGPGSLACPIRNSTQSSSPSRPPPPPLSPGSRTARARPGCDLVGVTPGRCGCGCFVKNVSHLSRSNATQERAQHRDEGGGGWRVFSCPPSVGGLDLGSDNSGCARLGGSKVPPPFGVVKEKVVVVVVLVRRHHRAVGTAVRRAVDDEVPGAVEE